ncbi:epoxide hydrolase 4-like [Hyalella azteca]|uniref:Epoxide hydrolase 4-like n=1 Tax=Hyalella azteca TaxID=294128 RepID=A0A8B7P2Z1_HYAAZ|nr:epoxide hydrolase 4-like [Hyalella azteca]
MNIGTAFNAGTLTPLTAITQIAKMSAYAASVSERKSGKNKKSRHTNVCRSKNINGVLASEIPSVTGFRLRNRLWRLILSVFEAYLTIAFAVLVSIYVLGRRLVTSKTAKRRRRNPYTRTEGKSKSGSCNDLSLDSSSTPDDELDKIRPPKCLEDPAFGSHKFIKIQGVKLHYVEAGAGRGRPTLLLVHGVCDFWFSWRRLIPALAKRFRVISLDMRGCGDSEKPVLRSSYSTRLIVDDVASFIRTLGDPGHDGLAGVSFIGAGWGGQIGWRLAQAYPGLVRKMVLIHSPHPTVLGSYYSPSPRNYYKLWPIMVARAPAVAEWVACEENLGLVSRLLKPLHVAKCISPEEEEAYFYNFSRSEDLTGALHHVRNWDLWGGRDGFDCSAVLSTPTLLLMGDSDPYVPLEAGYKSAEFVERIKTRVLVGAGAWAPVTHHGAVLEELAVFFNEPRILDANSVSTDDDDWDDKPDEDEEINFSSRSSIVGRMMGAGLSVVSRWNGARNQDQV